MITNKTFDLIYLFLAIALFATGGTMMDPINFDFRTWGFGFGLQLYKIERTDEVTGVA